MLNKIWSEHIIRKRVQLLEHDFLFNRSDKCVTVSVFEEMFDESTDSVTIFNLLAASLLFSKTVLKVLFWFDRIIILVEKSKCKVSNHP